MKQCQLHIKQKTKQKLFSVFFLSKENKNFFQEQIATIETDHQHELTKLKKQCETSEEEVEQLKIHIQYLQQINSNHEKLLTNSETLQIGIKNDFNRDNTLAWSDNEHQQGEVNILSVLLLIFI